MHFKQIEAFVQVAREKSFSKAAKAMYLSQPTISAHITALEEELQAKLLVRSTKEVYPSKAGRIFYQYALEILTLRDKALLEVKSYSTELKGTLTIAASTVPAQYLLPEILPCLVGKYPDICYSILQCDSIEVLHKIQNSEAEIGLSGTAFEKNSCVFEPFTNDQLVLITPNTEYYRSFHGVIPWEEFKKVPFLFRESGSGTRKESEVFLSYCGIDAKQLHCSIQLQSTESIIQAVKNNLGISIVSARACQDQQKFGMILSFPVGAPCLQRSFYLVYHKSRPLSPAAEAFLREVRKIYSQQEKATNVI